MGYISRPQLIALAMTLCMVPACSEDLASTRSSGVSPNEVAGQVERKPTQAPAKQPLEERIQQAAQHITGPPDGMTIVIQGRSAADDMLTRVMQAITEANLGTAGDASPLQTFVPKDVLSETAKLIRWRDRTQPSDNDFIRRIESAVHGPFLMVIGETMDREEAHRQLRAAKRLVAKFDRIDLDALSDAQGDLLSDRLKQSVSREIASVTVIAEGDDYFTVFSQTSSSSAGPFNSGVETVEATTAVMPRALLSIWLTASPSHNRSTVRACEDWTRDFRLVLDAAAERR